MVGEQGLLPLQQVDSEEEASARDECATIVGHVRENSTSNSQGAVEAADYAFGSIRPTCYVLTRRGCGKLTRRAKFRLTRRANQRYQFAPSFPGKRGGRASSRTGDKDEWDAAASARNGVVGRVSRERSIGAQDERRQSPVEPFGEGGWLRTAKACGSGTRCWCQVGGGFRQPNRSDKNHSIR